MAPKIEERDNVIDKMMTGVGMSVMIEMLVEENIVVENMVVENMVVELFQEITGMVNMVVFRTVIFMITENHRKKMIITEKFTITAINMIEAAQKLL